MSSEYAYTWRQNGDVKVQEILTNSSTLLGIQNYKGETAAFPLV